MQAAQDFAGYAGAHAVVLVECPAAVEVFGGVELAHIVEHGGEGAVPVHAEPFFGVALHALDGVVKHAFDVPVVVALLLNAGQGGDFGHEAVQKLGFKEELHELPHGFGGDLAPFFHDFAGGHVVEDTVGGLDDAHPRVRVDGQIEVRRVAQGTDGEQVVLGERLARQADQLDASGLVEVFELLSFGVVGVGAFELALELEFGEEARKASVDFSVRIQLPPSLPLGEPQLCSIFGNLLENALDACRECTDSAPFIRICAQEDAGHIVIAVDNTCCHPPIEENGRFRSTKHDGFGTGTASIRSIAERYQGLVDFRYEDGIFYASVMLKFDSKISHGNL